MSLGVSGVQQRMEEIRARMQQLSAPATPASTPPPPPPPPTSNDFSALMAARSGLYGQIGSDKSVLAPFDPMSSELSPTVGTEQLKSLATEAAKRHGIDPALFDALVQQESGYDPSARSHAGAVGLTQLMPLTAADLGVTDRLDPVQSLDGGAKYLKKMLERFNGDPSLALAAYNAGPGAVERAGGIPNIPETQDYVRKILGRWGRP